jgi:5-methyltetrahydrofolate--homocysteine methyltransferase
MEPWELCCNAIISRRRFPWRRFKDFPHSLKRNNDLSSQPQAIKAVHAAYFEAGADIETNTFSGTTIGMADYHLEDIVYELNYESAKLPVK